MQPGLHCEVERSSLRHRGFEGVGFGCRLPTSTFLDHFRVAGRVFPSFNQPTCTASIETEPPSTPSTGNVSGSDGVRVPAT